MFKTNVLIMSEISNGSFFSFFVTHKHSWNFEYKWVCQQYWNLTTYSDSIVLTTTLIYKYRLQWVCLQRWHQTHTIQNMFDSISLLIKIHNFRKILIILESFIKIYSLSCFCIYKKRHVSKKTEISLESFGEDFSVSTRSIFILFFVCTYVEL